MSDASDYAPEIKSNLKSCLQVRIGSLVTREMGNVFDVPGSTYAPEDWLNTKCVIELESLGPDAANFLTLLLLTIIRELLRQNPKASKDKPRHVIFLEEAHNLIGPTTVSNAENGDAKVASTKYIVDMLAEVRALREAIVIADQLPTGLAPQVTKNTSLKIGHRITAIDDRELLASTMSADGVQLERMAMFQPGHALCAYENVQKPFEVQISEYKANSESPDNAELFNILKIRPVYQMIMEQDCSIMEKKFRVKKSVIENEIQLIEKGIDSIQHDLDYLNSKEGEPSPVGRNNQSISFFVKDKISSRYYSFADLQKLGIFSKYEFQNVSMQIGTASREYQKTFEKEWTGYTLVIFRDGKSFIDFEFEQNMKILPLGWDKKYLD